MRRRARCTSGVCAWIASVILGAASASHAASAAEGPGPLQRGSSGVSPAFDGLIAARRTGAVAGVEAALAALAGFPRAALAPLLERAVRGDDEEARAALALLERIGTAEDLGLAMRLARPGSESDLEPVILAIGRRDARTLTVLEPIERGAGTAVRAALVRAVEPLGSPAAAAWIARCAERAPDVRPEALARLGRLVRSQPSPAPEDALRVVRGVLAGIEGDALREAVVAAGRMEDGESIPHLIALLGDEDPGLRADAAWALEQITGLRLRERVERWEAWYAVEISWWRDRSDAVLADLEGGDRVACARALLEIAGHRSERERLALRVLPLLEDSDHAVARLAAQTLRALRSKVAVPALLRALGRTEPGVASEAWTALRAITRKDLPCDAGLWRAACRG